jgi:hypothetical protein
MDTDKTALGQVVSHLRKVEKVGRDAVTERETMFDLYLTSYETGMTLATHTHEPKNGYAQAKLVEKVAVGLQTGAGRAALIAAVDIMIEREEHIDPETGEITVSHGKASDGMDPSADQVSPQARNPNTGIGSANEGGNDVDRSAERAEPHTFDENASLAAREGEKAAATNSPVTATNSQITPDPHTLGADDGQRSIPSSSPAGVKSDGLQAIVGQGRESEMGNSGTKEEQAVDQFTPPAFLAQKSMRDYRPHCQRPDACGASGLKHCYSCSKLVPAESEVA